MVRKGWPIKKLSNRSGMAKNSLGDYYTHNSEKVKNKKQQNKQKNPTTNQTHKPEWPLDSRVAGRKSVTEYVSEFSPVKNVALVI